MTTSCYKDLYYMKVSLWLPELGTRDNWCDNLTLFEAQKNVDGYVIATYVRRNSVLTPCGKHFFILSCHRNLKRCRVVAFSVIVKLKSCCVPSSYGYH